jgi:hypothetical protein
MYKIIPNTFDLYESNSKGEIKRINSFVKNNTNGGKREIGIKNLKPKTKKNGYLEVSLSLPNGSKSFYVHRLIVNTFLGEIPKGFNVNHIDGNKKNNCLENLEIITYSENSKHSYHILKNKIPVKQGDNHHNAKLNSRQVIEIRNFYDLNGLSDTKIKFNNIPYSTLRKIIKRNTWKHI